MSGNFEFDPGGFFVCDSNRFMFILIAKNASTTLKKLVYSLEFPERPMIIDDEEIHDFFGYRFDGVFRISLSDAGKTQYADYTRFAVYRDPVERFLSLYSDKVSPLRERNLVERSYFVSADILGASLDEFIDFSEAELEKEESLSQDEHLRRQSDFYSSSDVKYIVPLNGLNQYLFTYFGTSLGVQANMSRGKISLSGKQQERIKRLYAQDYAMLRVSNYLG